MAIIYSYPQIGELATGDTIAISDASNGNKTKSVTIGQLDSYINTGQATIVQVDDRVVTGASFNTSTGLLTLTRNGGEIPSVTVDLDGRYALTTSGVTSLTAGLDYLTNEPTVNLSSPSGDVTIYGQTSYLTGSSTFGGSLGTGVGLDLRRYLSYNGGITQYPPSTIRLAQGNNFQITTAKVSNIDQITFSVVGDTITSLTTTGISGPATFANGVLNIPQYSGGGGGGTVTQINTTSPISGGSITTSGTIGITKADGTTDGYLSSTDWNTFNNKSSFDGQYSSLTGAPTLATVATTGSYNDLSDKPTIPTVPANIVETVITTDGSFVALTPTTATDGNVTVTADLSATGTADATTFLRGDNTWAVPSGGSSGVTSIIAGTGIGIDQSTGDVTITNTGSATGGYTALTRTFSGSELVNAFSGNVADEIVLVTVPAGYQAVILGEVIAYLDYNTGTTDYTGTNLALKINSITGANFVALSNTMFTNSSFPFQITNGQTDVNQIIGTSGLGENITLISNSTSQRANFTAGDRDFTISFTYRLINLNL